jgi:PAS domain S-box-containing protein
MIRDARIFYVNNAAGEDLGYTREELVGMSIPDIDPDFSHKGWPLY